MRLDGSKILSTDTLRVLEMQPTSRYVADKNKSLFNALGYQGLPVVIVIKNGKQTFFKNEFVSEEDLRKAL